MRPYSSFLFLFPCLTRGAPFCFKYIHHMAHPVPPPSSDLLGHRHITSPLRQTDGPNGALIGVSASREEWNEADEETPWMVVTPGAVSCLMLIHVHCLAGNAASFHMQIP